MLQLSLPERVRSIHTSPSRTGWRVLQSPQKRAISATRGTSRMMCTPPQQLHACGRPAPQGAYIKGASSVQAQVGGFGLASCTVAAVVIQADSGLAFKGMQASKYAL